MDIESLKQENILLEQQISELKEEYKNVLCEINLCQIKLKEIKILLTSFEVERKKLFKNDWMRKKLTVSIFNSHERWSGTTHDKFKDEIDELNEMLCKYVSQIKSCIRELQHRLLQLTMTKEELSNNINKRSEIYKENKDAIILGERNE